MGGACEHAVTPTGVGCWWPAWTRGDNLGYLLSKRTEPREGIQKAQGRFTHSHAWMKDNPFIECAIFMIL